MTFNILQTPVNPFEANTLKVTAYNSFVYLTAQKRVALHLVNI